MSVNEHFEPDDLHASNAVPVPASIFHTSLMHPVFPVQGDELSRSAASIVKSSPVLPDISRLNRTEKFFFTALCEAVERAGLSIGQLRNMRTGIAVGTTVGSTFTDHRGYNAWKRGEVANPQKVMDYLQGNLARLTHDLLGTTGPAAVVVNACSSGTDAIGIAMEWLRQDMCDLCLAGGADELSIIPYHGFSSLQLLDSRSCRPFDADRSGLNLGEGAACLVLEKHDEILKRKGRAAGRLLGYGAASDAWHPTAPHPQGRGLARALEKAMHDAGILQTDINFINAHGTGTRANDQAECHAMDSFFRNYMPPVVSTKGATGHALGAAGAIEAVLTLLALAAGRTWGTRGCMVPDSELAVPVLSQKTRIRLDGAIGISQSLAFGGNNSVLIIEALTDMHGMKGP